MPSYAPKLIIPDIDDCKIKEYEIIHPVTSDPLAIDRLNEAIKSGWKCDWHWNLTSLIEGRSSV